MNIIIIYYLYPGGVFTGRWYKENKLINNHINENNIVSIILRDEVQALELSNCKFINYNKALLIEGIYDFIGVYNNIFLGEENAISIERLYQKRTFIYNNKFINNNCIFVKSPCLDNSYMFIKKLISSNDDIIVCFKSENEELIAKYYYVYNDKELIKTLLLCYEGSVIYVTGMYTGEYYIKKSIVLKGFDKCIFKGIEEKKIQYALTLDSQYIEIYNIEINKYYYGIRILKSKEQHIEIRSCFIKNCTRRGISIWPGNVGKYNIVENIFFNNGIDIFSTTRVKNCFNIYL